MSPNKTDAELESMAEEILELGRLASQARSRQGGSLELTESEFLTLDVLSKSQPLTIGELQKHLGVLPAQMSRIIRALEEHTGKGFVRCEINPEDRRRVDVNLTQSGVEAHAAYRCVKLGSTVEVLRMLEPADRDHFMRVMRKMHTFLSQKLASETK
jgi:DNA-binding MarR family transcriptional regulator